MKTLTVLRSPAAGPAPYAASSAVCAQQLRHGRSARAVAAGFDAASPSRSSHVLPGMVPRITNASTLVEMVVGVECVCFAKV
jgi:hypothetical protein